MAIYDLNTDVWGYSYPETKLRFAGPMSGLLNEAQIKYEAARKVNEERYRDILRGYRERYEQAMKLLEGLGSQAKSDILKRVLAAQNAVIADLVQRGLGSSTILPSIKAGYQREAEDAIRRLEESLRQQRLATHGQLSGDVLGFMERRRDEYPNLTQLYDVVFRAVQAQNAASGYGPPPNARRGGFVMAPSYGGSGGMSWPIQRPSGGIVGRRYVPGYFVGRGYSPSYGGQVVFTGDGRYFTPDPRGPEYPWVEHWPPGYSTLPSIPVGPYVFPTLGGGHAIYRPGQSVGAQIIRGVRGIGGFGGRR